MGLSFWKVTLVIFLGVIASEMVTSQTEIPVGTTEEEGVVLPPEDRTALVGDFVVLRCEVNPGVTPLLEWFEYITTPTGRKIFSSVDGLLGDPDKYSIQGTYNLVVLNATLSDGGLYGCLTPDMTVAASASVVIMEKPVPLLESEMYEDLTYDLECRVSYGSAPPTSVNPAHIPYMEAFIGNRQLVNSTQTVEEDGVNRFTLIEMFTYVALDTDDNELLDCRVFTENPAFESRGRVTMNVLYSVRDLHISPRKLVYGVGEKATCSARGNPSLEYMWYAVISPAVGDRVVEGGDLEMMVNMVGQNVWRCEARQTLNGTEGVISGMLNTFTVEQNSCHGRVMFSADISGDFVFELDETVIFNRIRSNCGGSYDANTGLFTCPADGYYKFYLNAKSDRFNELAGMDLVLDGSRMFRANSPPTLGGTTNQGIAGSNSMIMYCSQGSQVWARQVYDEGSFFENANRGETSFSGLLLV